MSETKDSLVVASELVSKPQRIAAPRYRSIKVYPMTGAARITIPPTARTVAQFEIPTRSINYSRSWISGKLTIVKGSTDSYRYRYADAVSFCSGVNLKSRSGATLLDMDYLQNYTQVVNKFETTIEDAMSADLSDVIASHRGFTDTKVAAKRPDGKTIAHPNVETQYCVNTETKATAVAGVGDLEWNFRIPLSRLVPNSVFSRRSDLKLPEIAVLTLSLGPGEKIGWESDSATDPTSNTAAVAFGTALDDFVLELATQEDPIYETMMDERMRAGFTIPINYPLHAMVNAPEGKTQSVAITYNSGVGNRLVKIYHVPFMFGESENAAYDHHHNHVETKRIGSYFIKLKGSRTTDEDLSTDQKNPSAYLHHKHLLEGTVITNANIYHYNFAHVEDLARIGGPKQWRELGFRKDDAEVGISLDQDYKFEFIAQGASGNNIGNCNHYTYAVVQRQLTVNAVGVMVQ